jgi:hypothetical protein
VLPILNAKLFTMLLYFNFRKTANIHYLLWGKWRILVATIIFSRD